MPKGIGYPFNADKAAKKINDLKIKGVTAKSVPAKKKFSDKDKIDISKAQEQLKEIEKEFARQTN